MCNLFTKLSRKWIFTLTPASNWPIELLEELSGFLNQSILSIWLKNRSIIIKNESLSKNLWIYKNYQRFLNKNHVLRVKFICLSQTHVEILFINRFFCQKTWDKMSEFSWKFGEWNENLWELRVKFSIFREFWRHHRRRFAFCDAKAPSILNFPPSLLEFSPSMSNFHHFHWTFLFSWFVAAETYKHRLPSILKICSFFIFYLLQSQDCI